MTVQFNQESLAERVILKPLIEKVSKGGIVISTDDRKQAINTNQGEVVMIGPMAWYDLPEKPKLKPGDKVYYAKYGAMVLKADGMEDFLVICNDKDILVGYTNE
jgi:co-chaperonin GroES (HSP10)